MATIEHLAAGSESSDRHLKKTLTFQDLFFLSMGGIIGSGWLLAVLGAGGTAGPAVILSWIIGGILVMFVALTYSEIAGMLPRSGAIVRYPHMTHGSFAGFLLGWSYMLTAVTVPTIESEAVVTYASHYIGGLTSSSTVNGASVTLLTGIGILFALVLIVVFFLLNYFGIKLMSKLNTVITWWKFIIPALTFILLLFTFNANNFSGFGGFAPLGISPIFQAIPTTGIVFAYLGFRQALDYGGEARNPQRDVPRATIFSVVAAVILYTLLQIAFIGALNWKSTGLKPGDWAGLTGSSWASAPFVSALQASGMALLIAFSVLLYIDAYVSPSGTGLVYAGTSIRTIYGMAVDGYLPAPFRRVNERWGIPVVSLLGALLVGLVFLLPLPSWYLLVGFISSATVLTYVMGGIGLLVMRRTAGSLHRPFRLPAAPVLAPIGFLSAALIVYWSGTSTLNYVVMAVFIGLPLYTWFYAPRGLGVNVIVSAIIGIVMLAAVLVAGYLGPGPIGNGTLSFYPFFITITVEVALFTAAMWLLSAPDKRPQIARSIWFIVMLLGLYLLSYLGPFSSQSKAPIPFGLDEVIVIVFGLIMFYWAVASGYLTPEIEEIVSIAAQKDSESAEPGGMASPSAG